MISTLRQKAKDVVGHARLAFYDFAWPKGVRWYRLDQEVKIPRYPAPASEPTMQMLDNSNEYDYKTSYRDSHYNIRYEGPHPNNESRLFIHEALGETVEEKMIRLGFIEKTDNKVVLKLESAKEAYKSRRGKEADQPNCMVDDFGLSEQPVEKGDRESMAQLVRQQFQANKEQNRQEDFLNDLNEIYDQKMKTFTGWGISDNDPVYQQLMLDIEYHLEQYIIQEKKVGTMTFFKGDTEYWNVLDNSHDAKNIQLTQQVVKDLVTDLGNNFNLDPERLNKLHNEQVHRKFEERSYPYNKNQTQDN